jgi:hypothetical protein
MSFCEACGSSLGPADRFCLSCGKPLTDTAPINLSRPVSQSAAGAPSTSSLPRPTAQRRSHTARNLTLSGAGIAVLVIAIIFLWSSGITPETSLQKAGVAYKNGDIQSFEKYVGTQDVLNDWTDQALNRWLAANHPGTAGILLAEGIAGSVKAYAVPRLVHSAEQAVLSGGKPTLQSTGANATSSYMMGFLSNGVRALVDGNLTYQGVESHTSCGSDVCLAVRIGTPVTNTSLLANIRMRRSGIHWRIVAIQDIAELMQQLHQSPT